MPGRIFDVSSAAMQFEEKLPWIDRFKVFYHLGVDGISVWFVLLTAFITVIVVLAGWEVIESRVAQYYASFLILSGLMIGVFAAADGLLFYVFFEATLIPMFIIIGVWGGPNRVYAAFKFFLYTLVGSVLMQRMHEERDLEHVEPVFFSTSNAGGALPASIACR